MINLSVFDIDGTLADSWNTDYSYSDLLKDHTINQIKEIPIVFKGRRKGKSKISRRICLEAIWKVPLLRLHA